jgi:thioredoxin 1
MSINVENISETEFEDKVIGSEVPVVVDFWAEWCGPCRIVGPVLESIAEARKGSVKVVKVNVDDNRNLAARFGISGIPTIMLFDRGLARETLVGARPRAEFDGMIDRALGSVAN